MCPPQSINLDPVHGKGEWRRYAQDLPWPADDGTVSTISARHVMEHIPAGQPRIDVMNEAHRVLIPRGIFKILVPLFPTWQAIADPTHVSLWCRESFDYFVKPIANADYGIRYWVLKDWSLSGEDGCLGTATLGKT